MNINLKNAPYRLYMKHFDKESLNIYSKVFKIPKVTVILREQKKMNFPVKKFMALKIQDLEPWS